MELAALDALALRTFGGSFARLARDAFTAGFVALDRCSGVSVDHRRLLSAVHATESCCLSADSTSSSSFFLLAPLATGYTSAYYSERLGKRNKRTPSFVIAEVHPTRLELVTFGFVDRCSIQLSYGCVDQGKYSAGPRRVCILGETRGVSRRFAGGKSRLIWPCAGDFWSSPSRPPVPAFVLSG